MKKKILIIGFGSMGKKYDKLLNKNFEIYYFDKKKLKKKNCLKTLDNIKKLNFFFSIISTPANTHKLYVKIMLKNNINFLVEKPLTLKKDGWKPLINLIKRKNIKCCVAYPRRHGVAYNFIKSVISKKIIGELKIIRTNYSQDFRKYRKDYKKIYYSSKKLGGGIVFDALTHHLNLITFFCGKIKSSKIFKTNLEIKDVKVPDTSSIHLNMMNGIQAFIFGNQFQKPNQDEIEFIGTKGNLRYDRIENRLYFLTEKKKILYKKFNDSYEDMFKVQIQSFINSILQNSKSSTLIEEDLHNISKLI
jgi:predicted dehydrogenase